MTETPPEPNKPPVDLVVVREVLAVVLLVVGTAMFAGGITVAAFAVSPLVGITILGLVLGVAGVALGLRKVDGP